MRAAVFTVVLLFAVAVAVTVGLRGTGQAKEHPAAPFSLPAALERLGAPPAPAPALAAVHRDAAKLLGGGSDGFDARLEGLRGTPVVVNKWAAWCAPCRAEFGILQQVSTHRGREVAFLGLDTQDTAGRARAFLAAHPVPYPTYSDPHGELARSVTAGAGFPSTVLLDRDGNVAFIRQGAYPSAAALEADLDRYVMDEHPSG